jgi:hypothetical protein
MPGGATPRLLSTWSNCFSETGFCRIMRSRSFSKAAILAASLLSGVQIGVSHGRLNNRQTLGCPPGRLASLNSQIALRPQKP